MTSDSVPSVLVGAEDLPHGTFGAAAGGHVQQSEAVDHVVLLTDGEGVPDDLVAGADGEEDGATFDGLEDVAIGLQTPDRGDLGRVLTASEKVHGAGGRDGVAGLHLGEHGVDAPPRQALAQHHRVAAVAVDAQQRLVNEDDLDGAHRRPAIFSSAWKGV